MLVGFDRDRAFYPTLLMVIATCYILFAIIGRSMPAFGLESLIAGAFFVLAVAGFKKNLWLIVVALAGHGVFDYLSPLVHSESRCPGVVARLLPFVRRSRRRFPCHAADATARIRFEGLELCQPPHMFASGRR